MEISLRQHWLLCRQNLLHKIKEMEDVHHEESMVSEHNIMEDLIDKIWRMSFARCLPALKSIHQSDATVTNDSEWSDLYNCD